MKADFTFGLLTNRINRPQVAKQSGFGRRKTDIFLKLTDKNIIL